MAGQKEKKAQTGKRTGNAVPLGQNKKGGRASIGGSTPKKNRRTSGGIGGQLALLVAYYFGGAIDSKVRIAAEVKIL